MPRGGGLLGPAGAWMGRGGECRAYW